MSVELRRDGDVVRLRIGCDVRLASSLVERLRDRVGAAGGSLATETLDAGGTLLHVELPCGVIVAEDVMLTREGIVRLLADAGVEVVAQTGDAATLLVLAASAPPRCRARWTSGCRRPTPTKACGLRPT